MSSSSSKNSIKHISLSSSSTSSHRQRQVGSLFFSIDETPTVQRYTPGSSQNPIDLTSEGDHPSNPIDLTKSDSELPSSFTSSSHLRYDPYKRVRRKRKSYQLRPRAENYQQEPLNRGPPIKKELPDSYTGFQTILRVDNLEFPIDAQSVQLHYNKDVLEKLYLRLRNPQQTPTAITLESIDGYPYSASL
jgi:hypothetical protein